MQKGLTRRKLLGASILAAPLIVPKKSLGLVHGEASTTFNPASLASTVSWWDASDLSTITESTPKKLKQLNDKIGIAPGRAPMKNGAAFRSDMDTGIRSVNDLNVVSCTHNSAYPTQSMSAPGWATGFPGAEGSIYIVAQVEQSWTGNTPNLFTIRDIAPTFTKAIWLLSEDHYHLYFYPSAVLNKVHLSRHGIESFSSYMDGIPHIWKLTWSASTGIATFTADGGLTFSLSGTGYVDFGSKTFAGPEIAINTYDPNGGTWQFCEMTLHNKAIADGSADDIAMINYLRNKWKTPGLPPKTKTTVRQAELSGGGYLGPLAIANDGTLLIAQNGPNCWRWNNGVNAQFENVFAQTRLPAARQTWGQRPIQALDVAIAPNNSNRIYTVASSATPGTGQVWRSDNSGQSWIDLGYPLSFGVHALPGAGPCMAVDPNNADHVLISATNGHIHESFDAGATFTDRAIAGSDYACIAFAPSSGKTMVGGHVVTAGIFIGWLAGASNVYRSTNGGASFSAMTGGPATAHGICCSSDGVVYACDAGGTTTNAWKFQSASWAHFTSEQMTASDGGWVFPAADPNHAGWVAFCSRAGNLQFSRDYGTTWYPSAGLPSTGFPASTDVAWLVSPFSSMGGPRPPNFGCNNSYASGRIVFDPTNNGRLYMTCAVGLFYTTPATYVRQTTPAIDWTQQNKNQQGLMVNDIVRVPVMNRLMNNMLFAVQNKAGGTSNAQRVGPTFMIGGPLEDHGLACDYAKNVTSVQYLLTANLWRSINFGADGFCGPDGTRNLGPVPGIGTRPMMAVQTTTNLVILSETGKVYSTNAGVSWNSCRFIRLSSFSASNGRSHVLVGDPVNASTYYVLLPAGNGFWRSQDSGANWAQMTAASPALPADYAQGSQLSAVPGHTRHLFFAAGNTGRMPLARTVDGGANWSVVTNVTEAWQVSAGATKPGNSYPSVFITGLIQGDSDPGVFRADNFTSTTDGNPTWTRVCRAPAGNMVTSNKLFADLDTYGTFYISMGSTGYCWGELDR